MIEKNILKNMFLRMRTKYLILTGFDAKMCLAKYNSNCLSYCLVSTPTPMSMMMIKTWVQPTTILRKYDSEGMVAIEVYGKL